MIYDCFSFFNELDLLEIRLNTLNDVVDKFVIVEANKTHSNKDKPFYFEESKERFSQFLDKIIYIQVTEYPAFDSTWIYENHQRNKIMDGLSQCHPNDIIIISDLDEIPTPTAIRSYPGSGIFRFKQQSYSFYLNFKAIGTKVWTGSRICTYSDFINNSCENFHYEYSLYLNEKINQGTTPTKIRIINSFPLLINGGWHFTYLGGFEKVLHKLDSFAHQEFNTDDFKKRNKIIKSLKNGHDLFNPLDNRYIATSLKELPAYVRENQKQYKHLLINYHFPFTFCKNIYIIIFFECQQLFFRKPFLFLKKIKKSLQK